MNRSPRRHASPPRQMDPIFSSCANPEDIISMDTFDEKSDIIYIVRKDGKYDCYDRYNLFQFLSMEDTKMAHWVGGDEMGYKGRPDLNFLFYKLPNGWQWITEDSVKLLMNRHINVFMIQLLKSDVPIGNVQGIMGVSMLHGQNPQNIYFLLPFDVEFEKLKDALQDDHQAQRRWIFEGKIWELLRPKACEGAPDYFVEDKLRINIEYKDIIFYDDEGEMTELKQVMNVIFEHYVFDLRKKVDGYDFDIEDCDFCMSRENESCPSPINNIIFHLQRLGWIFSEEGNDDDYGILVNPAFPFPFMFTCIYTIINHDGRMMHRTITS